MSTLRPAFLRFADAANKLRQALANIMPNVVLAEQHRRWPSPVRAKLDRSAGGKRRECCAAAAR